MQTRVVGTQDEGDGARGREAPAQIASLVERSLFRSALDFYGAAGAAIEYRERARVRCDLDALQGVRAAMSALERRIGFALSAGLSPERIARITRLESDVLDRIVERQRAGLRE